MELNRQAFNIDVSNRRCSLLHCAPNLAQRHSLIELVRLKSVFRANHRQPGPCRFARIQPHFVALALLRIIPFRRTMDAGSSSLIRKPV
jgi:hypothetical protein